MSNDYDENGLLKPEAAMTESQRKQQYTDNIAEKIEKELEILQSLGYNSDTVLKMVQTAPTLFSYNSEDIKHILNSLDIQLPEKLNISPDSLILSQDLEQMILPKQADIFTDVELSEKSQDIEHSHGAK